MFIRKKTISMDGAEVTIAPLTARQVEEHILAEAEVISGIEAARGSDPGAVAAALKKRDQLYRKLVCTGLNNASGDGAFTVDKTYDEDNVLIDRLQREIMEMSGLGFVTRERPPGET